MAEEATTFSEPTARDVTLAVRRATFGKCPACGNGKLYRKYLKVADTRAARNCIIIAPTTRRPTSPSSSPATSSSPVS